MPRRPSPRPTTGGSGSREIGRVRFRGISGVARVILLRMKLWIAAALLTTGCYRSAAPTEPPPEPRPSTGEPQPAAPAHAHRSPAPARLTVSDAIAKMQEFTDEMCACTDKTCADAVAAKMTQWSQEMTQLHREEDMKPSEEDIKEMTAVAERLGKCMMTAMAPGGPSSPPTP